MAGSRIALFGLAALSAMSFLAQPQKAPNPPKRYFLNVDEQWCVYDSESQWESDGEKAMPDESNQAGFVEYQGRRVAHIHIETPDAPGAGDWGVFDDYSLAREQLRTLERTISVLPGETSTLEQWTFYKGKPERLKRVVRELASLTPTVVPPQFDPELPVFPSVNSIPFWPWCAAGSPWAMLGNLASR